MTREETKEAIEVMQHFADGGEIQVKWRKIDNRESVDTDDPKWNWSLYSYQIKPKNLKVTEEEKEIISKTLIWVKNKVTGKVDYYRSVALDTCREKFLILNPDTMEWEDRARNEKENQD